MVNLLGLIAVPLLSIHGAFASANYAPCIQARIASLKVTNGSEPTGRDYCQELATEQVPAEIRAVVAQVFRINQKAAELFELPLEKVIAQPFELLIHRNAQGPLSSHVQSVSSRDGVTTTLTLGVFTDWRNQPFNAGVYAHELGHVILESGPNRDLPEILTDLSGSPLLVEMVADLVALHTTGHIVSPEDSLPICLQQFRHVVPALSYHSAADEFSLLAGWRRFDSCCRSLSRSSSHTAQSRSFCEDFRSKAPRPPMRSLGSLRMSADLYARHPDWIEPHQLGLPFLSFISEFAAETGMNVQIELVRAMREVSRRPKLAFSCAVPRLTQFLSPSLESSYSLAQVIGVLQEVMTTEQRESFARHWQTHRMDIWLELAAIDSADYAGSLALTHRADAYNALSTAGPGSHTVDPRLRQTGCWRSFDEENSGPSQPGYLDADLPGCGFACRPEVTRSR